jgi:glycosyltransferase involved in cell wall biosynthesis
MDEFKLANPQARGEFRQKYGLGKEFVVACVGRIKVHRKGQEVLVEAAAILKERGVRLKVVIIGAVFPGNESSMDILKKMVRESALEDIVIFTGELEDVKPAYAAMDVLVMPSALPEPLGDVMMEAMAMKVPVIASNIGGPLEVVQEGVNGFLVPASDPEALADKIEVLMKDPKLRERMGEGGPARVMELFYIGDMTRKIEELYDKAKR